MPSTLFPPVPLPVPVDHPVTHSVPLALPDCAAPRMRAVVPFKKRMDTGYIVGLDGATEVKNVRELLELPDPEPVVSGEMIELCTSVADYDCCSLGEALQCAVPAGRHQLTHNR